MSNKRMAEIFEAAAAAADPLQQQQAPQQFTGWAGSQNLQPMGGLDLNEIATGRTVARVLRAIASSYRRAAEEMPDGN